MSRHQSRTGPRGSFHADDAPSHGSEADEACTTTKRASERAELAKEIHDFRRARDAFFPVDVFAEPAWDILLILYWARFAQESFTISNVCSSAAVPPTTALRWIERLLDLGFVHKTRHPTDHRVTWLELTDDANERLDRYLDVLGTRISRIKAPTVNSR